MPQTNVDQGLWEREHAFLEGERAAKPELFKADPEIRKTVLPAIGITTMHPDLPTGYIRYSPLDFLVEEISADGEVVEIVAEPKAAPVGADQGTIYADLVKIAISTLDAVQRIADALKLTVEQVRYAGIKDALAVTAQRISIRGASLAQVSELSVPNVILKNLHEGKGVMAVGGLKGNRFTLFIRVKPDFDATAFSKRLGDVNQFGVINFYGPQRFGVPRFLSHVFGLYLMRGDLEGLLRCVLVQPSPTELAYHAGVRARAEAVYGDWKAVREILATLPYGFRHELAMLDAFTQAGGGQAGYVAAVHAVSQQANLWVRAYASYLANHLLSEWGRDPQEMPESLPLLLSQDPKAREIYRTSLSQHGTDRFLEHLRPFRFINIGKAPEITTRVFPVMRGVKVVPEGVAIAFELPKAAYATTVLMHLFDAITGSPLPDWIRPEEVDAKEILGLGSIAEIRSAFRKEIDLTATMRKAESAESEG